MCRHFTLQHNSSTSPMNTTKCQNWTAWIADKAVIQLQQVFKWAHLLSHRLAAAFSPVVIGLVNDWLLQTRPHTNQALLKVIHILYWRLITLSCVTTKLCSLPDLNPDSLGGQSSGPMNCGVSRSRKAKVSRTRWVSKWVSEWVSEWAVFYVPANTV